MDEEADRIIAILEAAKRIHARSILGFTYLLAADRALLAGIGQVDMARARLKLLADIDPPPVVYVVTIGTIPDETNIPAGEAYSSDFTAYLGGADLGLATISIEAVSGSLAALDLSFNATTHVLSGATPEAGTASFQLVARIAGIVVARSNTFLLTVEVVTTPDNFGPTESPSPQLEVVSTTAINATALWPADPNPDGAATGIDSGQWMRSSGGAYSSVGSPVSPSGLGERPAWTSATIGTMTGTNGVSVSGGELTVTVSSGGLGAGTSPDAVVVAHTQATSFFDFYCEIPSYTSANAWCEVGLMVRSDLTPTAAMIAVQAFTPASNGVAYSYRPSGGASRATTSTVPAPTPRWLRLVRGSGSQVITAYYLNASNVWTLLGAQTISTTDPVYLCVYACRNGTGATDTIVVTPTVNKLGSVVLNDTGLTASTAYTYRFDVTDVQGHTTLGNTATATTVTPEAPPSGDRRWNPGFYLEDPTHIHYNATAPKGRPSLTGLWPGLLARNVKGVNLHPHWASWNPTTRGVFTFSFIEQYIDLAHSHGLKVIFDLWWSTIASGPVSTIDSRTCPAYLAQSAYGGMAPTSYGNSPKFWRPIVMDAWIESVIAFYEHFKDHPALEGIILPETAWNWTDNPVDSGYYSSTAVEEQYIRMIAECGTAIQDVWLASRANWIVTGTAGMQRVMTAHRTYKVGVGSTDTQPNRVSDADKIMMGTYGGAFGSLDHRDLFVIPAHVEHQPYYGTNTPSQIITYNKNSYGTTHLMVFYHSTGTPTASYWDPSWLNAIAGQTLNTAYPSLY